MEFREMRRKRQQLAEEESIAILEKAVLQDFVWVKLDFVEI
jgi:hypothetical protein